MMKAKTSLPVLISVRNAAEAEEALAGGATFLDVKEPSRGSLGPADEPVLRQVAEAVRGRARLTAACGELLQVVQLPNLQGYWAAKVGLAGCARHPTWPKRLAQWAQALDRITRTAGSTANTWSQTALGLPQARSLGYPSAQHSPLLVPVAYADHDHADAPSWQSVFDTVLSMRWPAVMVDTWCKDGRCLFDYVGPRRLQEWVRQLQRAGVLVGLAGSLRFEHVPIIQRLTPTIVAFRGAVCAGRSRDAPLSRQLVNALLKKLGSDSCSFTAYQLH